MPRRSVRAFGGVCAVLAAVVSVDLSPAARDYLLRQGWKDVWVTDVYQTCPKGFDLPVVEGGVPDAPESWDIVRTGGLAVYVPKGRSYKGDIPRLVHFRRSDKEWVGVANGL